MEGDFFLKKWGLLTITPESARYQPKSLRRADANRIHRHTGRTRKTGYALRQLGMNLTHEQGADTLPLIFRSHGQKTDAAMSGGECLSTRERFFHIGADGRVFGNAPFHHLPVVGYRHAGEAFSYRWPEEKRFYNSGGRGSAAFIRFRCPYSRFRRKPVSRKAVQTGEGKKSGLSGEEFPLPGPGMKNASVSGVIEGGPGCCPRR